MYEPEERDLLIQLDLVTRQRRARACLERAADRLQTTLQSAPDQGIAFEVVSDLLPPLPSPVRSAWMFILRRGIYSGAERHPNSRQRMVAYRGAGDFQTWDETAWRSQRLTPDVVRIEDRWISIPENVWHQAAPPLIDWIVVSFHTVPAAELIEERGDPASSMISRHSRYLE